MKKTDANHQMKEKELLKLWLIQYQQIVEEKLWDISQYEKLTVHSMANDYLEKREFSTREKTHTHTCRYPIP